MQSRTTRSISKSRLVLLRVVECEPPGLLSGLAYWDLVPIRNNPLLLKDIVLDAVLEGRRDAGPSGPYWRAPRPIVDAEAIRPVPSFSGREEELAELSTALSSDKPIAVVYGLGGAGKSSVAREYARRNRDRYSVIWLLNAQTDDAIIDGLLRLGAVFVRGLDQLADRRAAAQQVSSSVLSGFTKPVLLIFDNLEDERLLRTWQPPAGSCVLVTSRNGAWSSDIAAIPLQAWELDVAIAYLQRESGRVDLGDAEARAIAEALGVLPLALAHTAALLRGMRMVTPGQYLERITEYLKIAPLGAEYPQSVFATLSTAIVQAEKEAAGTAAVLCFAASFAPDAIPDELFRQPLDRGAALQPTIPNDALVLDLKSAFADNVRLDEALGALDRLQLLTFAAASRTYSIHRLVQLAARDMVAGIGLAWRECVVAVAEAAFPHVEFATWPQCARLSPHAQAALDALPGDVVFLAAAHLANRCALYLWNRGEYGAAEPLYTRALAIREKTLGPDHPDVAKSLNNLAILYSEQERYGDAEPLLTRALAIVEKALGPDHPAVAQSLNDLAGLYDAQGRYQEAEPLLRGALAIWEKALGPDHADVAQSLTNLSAVYEAQGRYGEAEPLYKRALAIQEKALGPDHPDVAFTLNGLAGLYDAQGRYAEAEPLYTRALAIHEKALGPDHPNLATSLNNLAGLYDAQGHYGEAEPLYARALAIREKALGADHPLTNTVRANLNALRSKS